MRVIAFTVGFEELDNYLDALRVIRDRGGRAEVVCVGTEAGTRPPSLGHLDLPCHVVPPASPEPGGAGDPAALEPVARWVCQEDPDIVFICDPQAAPGNRLAEVLRRHGSRALIVGGQGALAAPRPGDLGADRLLCFGPRQVGRLRPEHRLSAHAVGLPRLDRLRGLPTSQAGYGVFLAHRSPEVPIVNAALALIEKHLGRPIVVCEHPGSPGRHAYRSTLPRPAIPGSGPGDALTRCLQHCSFVLATDSTHVLDALYLGKPVVLLPSGGLPAFDHYPGIADGFGPAAINEAFQRIARQPEAVAEFLQEAVGGRRYDHAERVATAFGRLAVSGPLRPVSERFSAAVRVEFSPEPLPSLATRVELLSLVPEGGRVAELGVAKGSFSDEMLRARADIHLSSIDRWAGDRGHDDTEYVATSELLGRHGPRSAVIRKSFHEALEDFAPESLDLVYIDGYAHNGQEGAETLEAWWTKVKPGGILSGHDYHPDWKLTVDTVDQFCRRHGLAVQLTPADFFPSWYLRKPTVRLAAAA